MGIALILFMLAIITLSIIAIYFQIYKRNINRALEKDGSKHLRMIPPYKVVSILLVAFVFCIFLISIMVIPYFDRADTAQEIEDQIRQHSEIEPDWNIEIVMSDSLAAVLAYDTELTNHTFAVYRNAHEQFPDYKFMYGGNTVSIERGVRAVSYNGSMALVSINALHIAKIECHDGSVFEIDPNSPFVIVLPSEEFDAYDSLGNLINIKELSDYELTKIEIAN